MTNCRSIYKAKCLFIAVVTVFIVLLTGHIAQSDKLKWENDLELIKQNFLVRKEILEVYEKSFYRFGLIFDSIRFKRINEKTAHSITIYDREQLLDTARENLSIDVPTALTLVHDEQCGQVKSEHATMFDQLELNALYEWRSINLPGIAVSYELFGTNKVKSIIKELDDVLGIIASTSKWTKQLREEAVDNPAPAKHNARRVVYESFILRVAVIRATFEIAMIAYNDKAPLKNTMIAYNNDKKDAISKILEHVETEQILKDTVEYMKSYLESVERVLFRVEHALKNDQKLTLRLDEAVYNDNDYYWRLGFNKRLSYAEMAQDNMETFAKLMGKEQYVPAVDGLQVVMMYELMQDTAALWQLEREIGKKQMQVEREDMPEVAKMDKRKHLERIDSMHAHTYELSNETNYKDMSTVAKMAKHKYIEPHSTV